MGVVLLNLGRAKEALPHFEEQLRMASELVTQDPLRVEHRYSLSEAYENLGRVAVVLRQKERARTQLNEALKVYDGLAARSAISAEYAQVPGRIRKELADLR